MRLAVVGAIAIAAVVLLVPQIRDLAATEDDSGIPEGFDIYRAASNGSDVYGVGGVLDGDTAHPRVFAFIDGEWEAVETPEGVGVFGDIAMDGNRVVVTGSAGGGAGAVWTATLPDLEWEIEQHLTPPADLRGVAITDQAIVAVGSVLDEDGDALVLVRSNAGWQTATLPGESVVPLAVVATRDGFTIGGSAANAPALWMSTDGLSWTQVPMPPSKGAVQALAARSDGALIAIGRADGTTVAFPVGVGSRTSVGLPSEDAGESAFAIAPNGEDGWVIVGQDVDVGDVVHAIKWTGDVNGHAWSLNERVAADRLSDVVIVDGRPFGVGSLERARKLTPVLIPL